MIAMRKKVLIILFSFLLLFLVPQKAEALKVRTRSKSSSSGVAAAPVVGVNSSVRFRPDRLALLINFSGFENIQSGTYELVYTADGVQQGLQGSIIMGDTETKTLLFGTCSGGVCNYHKNISNMRLSIYSTLQDGRRVLKPYRIQV